MKNIKEKMQKIGKFIASRMFYLILGICIAVAIPIAYAAWNSTVSSGQTLTTALWNDVVAKLVELDSRTTTLESGNIYRTGWQLTPNTCYTRCGADFCVGTEQDNSNLMYSCNDVWVAGKKLCVCLKL